MSDTIIIAVLCVMAAFLLYSGLRELKRYWQAHARTRREVAELEEQMAQLRARLDGSDQAGSQGGLNDDGPL